MAILQDAGMTNLETTLKLQSVGFASMLPSLFENLELQLLVELFSLRGVVLWHGFSTDESNVLR